jgi:uncharacterized membrane protein YgcG
MLYTSLLSDRLYLAGGRAERGESDTSHVQRKVNSPTFVQRIFGLHLHKPPKDRPRPLPRCSPQTSTTAPFCLRLDRRRCRRSIPSCSQQPTTLPLLTNSKKKQRIQIMPASTATATTASSSNAAVPSSGGGGGGRGGRGRYGSRGGGGGGGGVSFGKLVENVSSR